MRANPAQEEEKMAIIKCKMCGGDLALTEGSSLAKCEYCQSVQTVPNVETEKKLVLFTRANRLRAACEFDKAFGVYEAIVAEFSEEAEAYWGLVLCKYGIEYVDDPATGKKVPTCHRSSYNSVMDDSDFEQVMENADAAARKVYREEAKQIEELRKGILEVSKNEEPYDIFICYKETAEDGQRTLDSVLAQDVYDALTDKGYRVFFSRITLEDKLGQEYEPYIFAALNSAKVMLAFGTDYEYFNAVWVRNEWGRFLKLMETDKNKHLIPCFKGIDAYDLPKEFAKLQAQDMGKVGAVQDLLRGVDKLITPAAVTTTKVQTADVTELLNLGNEALENGEWETAANRFDLALMADPKCAEAHLGRLMADRKWKKQTDLAKSWIKLEKFSRFREAMTYASDALKQELDEYSEKVKASIKKRTIRTTIISIVAVLIATISSLEIVYHTTVKNFGAGTLDADTAYTRLNGLKWYRKADGDMLFLAAAGSGHYDEARKYIPETITWTPATAEILKTAAKHMDLDMIETIIYPEGTEKIESASLSTLFKNLKNVVIPDSVTLIGDYAFNGCKNLTSVTIPESVAHIGKGAFSSCSNLTSVTIPKSVAHIGEGAFSSCSNLTSVKIPDGVTEIGKGAFNGCINLTSIRIPAGVTVIEEVVFSGCSNLVSVTIPDGVTEIGNSAFSTCRKLASVTIPDSVKDIRAGAFHHCSSLKTITIPDSVTTMGTSVFDGCESLQYIYCEASEMSKDWDTFWKGSNQAQVIWGSAGPA